MTAQTPVRAPVVLDPAGLSALVEQLQEKGYLVVGPTVRSGAVVLDELSSAAELPWGYGVDTEAGSYRLRPRSDRSVFAHSVGPQPWKRFLLPPRSVLWRARRGEDGFVVEEPSEPPPRLALLGVRSCDLRAIGVQDRVLLGGAHRDSEYAARRASALIVAVNCTVAAATCFCDSIGTGPAVDGWGTTGNGSASGVDTADTAGKEEPAGPGAGCGYDLVLTEVVEENEPWFLAQPGSADGANLLDVLPQRRATPADLAAARAAVEDVVAGMNRRLPTDGLRELLVTHREDPRWDKVGDRCLTCGNCTLVCPTCFCTTVEDVTNLTGDVAERRQRWDSCFDLGFSYLHGESVRGSNRARYRHWLSHKLGTWQDQFGELGCVGCGRCITWCPVGIDITEEIAALRSHPLRGQA